MFDLSLIYPALYFVCIYPASSLLCVLDKLYFSSNFGHYSDSLFYFLFPLHPLLLDSNDTYVGLFGIVPQVTKALSFSFNLFSFSCIISVAPSFVFTDSYFSHP